MTNLDLLNLLLLDLGHCAVLLLLKDRVQAQKKRQGLQALHVTGS